ncbi:hypothetical protein PACTADRAFT_51060 [Pachysolen tannophilus NRRL Y-2460]|uniref:Uncharacterized protein n=1 Tax=Pachysolen tannophilus NRRL Y-2460 TaxID=669874 RepID=A0A1E4TR23_PACTA|nr:hypothetical protein PACTADRAFT_51060 [Pachysolen tannophilus NRRL Y-2460]
MPLPGDNSSAVLAVDRYAYPNRQIVTNSNAGHEDEVEDEEVDNFSEIYGGQNLQRLSINDNTTAGSNNTSTSNNNNNNNNNNSNGGSFNFEESRENFSHSRSRSHSGSGSGSPQTLSSPPLIVTARQLQRLHPNESYRTAVNDEEDNDSNATNEEELVRVETGTSAIDAREGPREGHGAENVAEPLVAEPAVAEQRDLGQEEAVSRATAAGSLSSMLNILASSSNSLLDHAAGARRNEHRNATAIYDGERHVNFEDMDRRLSSWRIVRANNSAHNNNNNNNNNINHIEKGPGVISDVITNATSNLSKTIFKQHFKHYLNTTRSKLDTVNYKSMNKKMDEFLVSRKRAKLMNRKNMIRKASSKKRKLSQLKDIEEEEIADNKSISTMIEPNSFLQNGIILKSAPAKSKNYNNELMIKITNVSYEENLVLGTFFTSNDSPTSNEQQEQQFKFHGNIIDFDHRDLRYTTHHGNDAMSPTSSTSFDDTSANMDYYRATLSNEHRKVNDLKKKLSRWFKLPPFNKLSLQKDFEKILMCNCCLKTLNQNFILMNWNLYIDSKKDFLHLLTSLNRLTGELFIISGELDYFKKCPGCNTIHDITSTGNSIIDNILRSQEDSVLRPLRRLIYADNNRSSEALRIFGDIRNGGGSHSDRNYILLRDLEENVWRDEQSRVEQVNNNGILENNSNSEIVEHEETSEDEFKTDKRLKSNNKTGLKIKESKKRNSKSLKEFKKKFSVNDIDIYDYDEQYVTKFVPYTDKGQFNDDTNRDNSTMGKKSNGVNAGFYNCFSFGFS